MTNQHAPESQNVDVVVLGTGAAGLTAALAAADAGASVALFEKAAVVGGTTALSGGVAWMPANRVSAQGGCVDSREQSLTYLRSLSNGSIPEDLVTAFVDNVAPTLDFLESRTPLKLQPLPIPDYHPEHPGGMPGGGRSIEPEVFSFNGLGAWSDRVGIGQFSDPETGHVYLATIESPRGGGTGVIGEAEMDSRRRDKINGRGRGMVGALLQACLDRGIVPVINARAIGLLQAGGRVTGVRLTIDGAERIVSARQGVVIATGGFEWDPDMATSFLRGPIEHPATVPTNTGDGQKMAMRAGARMGNMREAWWMPVALLPGVLQYGRQKVLMILRERSIPGTIMVNHMGKRFVNEATNYNALGTAFHHFDPASFTYANLPCWLICDRATVEKYGFLHVPPGSEMPDWIPSAQSLEELAQKVGIDPAGLRSTVDRWNTQVAAGADTDFARGESAYDGFNGDLSQYPGKGATLGQLKQGPFYALQIHSSTLGTKGGARTDVNGAVLDYDGLPIPGLYAAGNAMAGATGMVYAGAGGTLGPALVFGFLAGRHAATHNS